MAWIGLDQKFQNQRRIGLDVDCLKPTVFKLINSPTGITDLELGDMVDLFVGVKESLFLEHQCNRRTSTAGREDRR